MERQARLAPVVGASPDLSRTPRIGRGWVSNGLPPAPPRDYNSRRRRPKRMFRTRRWARQSGTPRPRWRELPWWPAFELRLRYGWSAPPAAACAVTQAPGPVPSARTLYRFAARIFPEWIRAKGIKLADVQIAWLRRRHLILSWYDCACQDNTRCPGLPPSHTRRHNRRGAGGRFEADWREHDKRWWETAKFGPRKANSTPSRCSAPKESGKSLSRARHSKLARIHSPRPVKVHAP